VYVYTGITKDSTTLQVVSFDFVSAVKRSSHMTTATLTKSATPTQSSNKKNASKGTARDLQNTILAYREDKVTASKVVTGFRRGIGQTIYANGPSMDDKVREIEDAAEAAKSQLLASIDRDVVRATTLVRIPRGTTGKGGLHHSDVTTEIFAALAKKTAIQNNTTALQSAGLI
jgi:soluble cytochrome b562